jgi:D-Tyr-tRNAtyr deacylase
MASILARQDECRVTSDEETEREDDSGLLILLGILGMDGSDGADGLK